MSNYNTSLKYAVDIAFCIDVTGSMAPVIDTVKDGALSFHKRLEDAMAAKGKAISQLRLRVIAYRDFGDSADDAIESSEFWQIPEQTTEFESFVRRLRATGGGDVPESGLEALALAINSPWERGLDRRRHIIAVFTDAPAHPLGVGAGARTYPAGVPSTTDDLFEAWGYGSSQAAVMENAAKRLLLFAPDTTPWNIIAADWNNTVYFPSQAGDGLAEVELTEIVDVIANSV
ncbi:MAG TPA: vWA domain-containing protein [Micromonosporaceae bacterium]|nr:vWA domain-containing protein [Micromonosporaceae bacterium]